VQFFSSEFGVKDIFQHFKFKSMYKCVLRYDTKDKVLQEIIIELQAIQESPRNILKGHGPFNYATEWMNDMNEFKSFELLVCLYHSKVLSFPA
jgi:hypothetical protein